MDSLARDLLLTDVGSLWLRLAADVAAKACLLLLLSLALHCLLRRSSSAFRHSLLTLSFICLLLLPLTPVLGLEWDVPLLNSPRFLTEPVGFLGRLYASPYFGAVLAIFWAVGFATVILRMLVGFWLVRRLRNGARPVDESWADVICRAKSGLRVESDVRVLVSDSLTAAVCAGVWRPVILMPWESEDWSDEQRLVILRHELGHLRRRDNWTNLMALLVCASHWFNPLVWSAARRLRLCREAACDDLVLTCGVKPSEYVSVLLQAASSRQGGLIALALSQAAALRSRLFAILDPAANRRLARTRQLIPCAVVAALALLVTAALQPWIIPAFRGGLERVGLSDRAMTSFLRWSWTPAARQSSSQTKIGFVGYSGTPAAEEVDSPGATRRASLDITSVAIISSPDFSEPDRVARHIADLLRAPSWSSGDERAADARSERRPWAATVRQSDGTPRPDDGSEADPPPAIEEIELSRVDLGTLGGNESAAADINETGQVVGQSTNSIGERQPFLWSKKTGITNLPCPSSECVAVDINNVGQVLISSQDAAGAEQAYLWSETSGLISVGTLGGASTKAVALNDLGQVVGSSKTSFDTENAFFWSAEAGIVNLGGMTAIGLNERGQVLGWAASYSFLWDSVDGSFSRVGPSGLTATPLDINNAGEVVGYASFEKGAKPKAFVWTREKGITQLALSDDTDGSCAFRVNDAGEVLAVTRKHGQDEVYLVEKGATPRAISLPSVLLPRPDWPERAEVSPVLLIGSNLPSFQLAEELAGLDDLKDNGTVVSQPVRMNGKGQIAGNLVAGSHVAAVLWEIRLRDVEDSIAAIIGQMAEIQAGGQSMSLAPLRAMLESSLVAVRHNEFSESAADLTNFLAALPLVTGLKTEMEDAWIESTWKSLERLSQFTVLQ